MCQTPGSPCQKVSYKFSRKILKKAIPQVGCWHQCIFADNAKYIAVKCSTAGAADFISKKGGINL
jgi:hypothetical protein